MDFQIGSSLIIHGECVSAMVRLATVEGVKVDAAVCDPPYHLASIVKRFGKQGSAPAKVGVFARASKGFMGKEWDGGDVAFQVATWRAVYDMLKPGGYLLAFSHTRTYHRMVCAIEDAGFEVRDMTAWLYGTGFPKSHKVASAPGWGTALKPALEPIVIARRPVEGTVAANVTAHGVGALNIDAARLPCGRWPANVVHDGSDEVGLGGNARFFYSAKASKTDRAGSKHPTVKPVALMRYLCRLVTPPGGIVLDPFAGSGTTGEAAAVEGFASILIEREAEYINDIKRRLSK